MMTIARIIRSWFAMIAVVLTVVVQASTGATPSLRGGAAAIQRPIIQTTSPNEEQEAKDFVLCRMVMVHSLLEETTTILDQGDNESRRGGEAEQAKCIPIHNNGIESDDILPMPVSFAADDTLTNHLEALYEGNLVMVITNARLNMPDHEITVTSETEYLVVMDDEQQVLPSEHAHHHRYLPEQPLQKRGRNLAGKAITGTISVAVLRISTTDSTPTPSVSDLEALFDTNNINFVTQYNECSVGKLNFVKASSGGVMDVLVNQPVAAIPSGSALVSAAQAVVRAQFNIESVSELADRVIMCLPPGTGDWVANAGINHWYAQFNNQWCTSLTANMHELGHTLGLLHANENSIKYGDSTGYMSKAYASTTGPQRCFNGQNSAYFGWYDDRKLTIIHPTNIPQGAQLVSLASFVDFSATTPSTPVLINIANQLYLQYNRATSFNSGTGEHADTVTVTTAIVDGATELVASLSPNDGQSAQYQVTNFNNSGHTLVIEACAAASVSGNNIFTTNNKVDTMTISIGMNKSLCSTAVASSSAASTTVPPAELTDGSSTTAIKIQDWMN